MVKKTAGLDSWNIACVLNGTNTQNCQDPAGPNYDFGQAPLLVNACYSHSKCILLAIATSKSGTTWALVAVTGKVVWSTESGPGSELGGSLFGSAYFVSQSNAGKLQYILKKPSPGSQFTTYGGAIVTLDILTGEILWQTANPTQAGGAAPVTYSNGVVYYSSNDKTGEILFEFKTIGTLYSCPSIVNGVVYVGSGYELFNQTGNNKVYALAP